MKLLKKCLLVLAVASSTMVTMNITSVETASAAICRDGRDCTNPDSTGCSGTASNPVPYVYATNRGYVYLRYSSGCRTIWGRSPEANSFNSGIFMARTYYNGNPIYTDTLSRGIWGNGSTKWTDQLNDAGRQGYACGYGNDGYTSSWFCTSRY